jgi:periplasmic protein TonB
MENRKNQNSPTLLELVFENRNRAYGAFQLRNAYAGNMGKALLLTLLIFGTVFLTPWFSQGPKMVHTILKNEYRDSLRDIVLITEIETPKRVIETPPNRSSLSQNTNGIPASSDSVVNRDTAVVNHPHFNPGGGGGSDSGLVAGTGGGSGGQVGGTDTITVVPGIPPEFPGGFAALMKYLKESTIYPQVAREAGLEGIVHVNFTVDLDGTISRVKVLNHPAPAFEKEAIRVVKNMPKWKPGFDNGGPVRSTFTLPIRFKLKK